MQVEFHTSFIELSYKSSQYAAHSGCSIVASDESTLKRRFVNRNCSHAYKMTDSLF